MLREVSARFLRGSRRSLNAMPTRPHTRHVSSTTSNTCDAAEGALLRRSRFAERHEAGEGA